MKIFILIAVLSGLLLVYVWYRLEINSTSEDKKVAVDTGEEQTGVQMDPAKEDFVIKLHGRATLSAQSIPIVGRYQIYVRKGSQYARWRQFPSAMRYEVITPSGKQWLSPDLTRSISEYHETFENYSAMPADQIVGKDFEQNAFTKISEFIDTPGLYKIRARYFGSESNWIDIQVEQ